MFIFGGVKRLTEHEFDGKHRNLNFPSNFTFVFDLMKKIEETKFDGNMVMTVFPSIFMFVLMMNAAPCVKSGEKSD